jgi:uncharacterized membrane-anchored protein
VPNSQPNLSNQKAGTMKTQLQRLLSGQRRSIVLGAAALIGLLQASATAQTDKARAEQAAKLFQSIKWQVGPTTAAVGEMAEIKVPAGYQFTGREGAAKLLEATGNPPDSDVVGAMLPLTPPIWFATFTYQDIGHVADDEKSQLDGLADSLLQTIRDATEKGNAYRRSKGVPEMTITGWITPPKYDEVSNNLVWAFGASSKNGQEANYDTRILGRTGVMSVKLVAGAEEIKPAIPTVKAMLTNFQYKPGHRYSEVRAGDKIAQYGLTGLITGGVILAAAKSGLLLKFWKLIVVGGAALFGGIWRALTGKTKTS